jgi:hypothetical protein
MEFSLTLVPLLRLEPVCRRLNAAYKLVISFVGAGSDYATSVEVSTAVATGLVETKADGEDGVYSVDRSMRRADSGVALRT